MAEILVPERSLLEVVIAIGKVKSYKSPGADQIPAELIIARGKNIQINTFIPSVWNKEKLPQIWK
jgi:hypothetical protein